MAQTYIRPSQINSVYSTATLASVLVADNVPATYTAVATENTMHTFSLVASQLGVNDIIKVHYLLSLFNNSGGNQTVTYRLKSNSTTIDSVSALYGNSATNNYLFSLDVILARIPASPTLGASYMIGFTTTGAPNTGSTPINPNNTTSTYFDPSVAQSFTLTAQGTSNTTSSISKITAVVQYFKVTP